MKQQLRKNIVKQLRSLLNHEKSFIEYKLHSILFQQPFWQQAQVIGLTHSTSIEWNTLPIIQQAWDSGKTVTLPVSDRIHKKLYFYQIDDLTDLQVGYANILEPKQSVQKQLMNQSIDLLIVPGLMFDYRGYRLGFGGGFYDRYLTEPHHVATSVSLASQFQLVEKLPIDNYDIPVDYIVTEETCLKMMIR